MAVVSSSNPNFLADAGKIAGVSAVASNAVVNWLPPQTNVAFEEDFGNPPNSGDNDTRFDLQWGHDAVDAPEAWTEGISWREHACRSSGHRLRPGPSRSGARYNFTLSKNFVAGETLSYALPDPFSHGSHVTGTIAAADNAFGT